MGQQYGATEDIIVQAHDDGTETTRREQQKYYQGGLVGHLLMNETSIAIDDKKTIMTKVFEAYQKHERGEIVGWSVNAEIYDPQTLRTKRIIVRTIEDKRHK